MGETKEKILMTALELLARDGYEAVSVRNIAEELGITKGALYRHYENKRDIYDSIVDRMVEVDAQRAEAHRMPVEEYEKGSEPYENTSLEDIEAFTVGQLEFWTQDSFASLFRKMLTLEQYRNAEMAKLYSQCIVEGPVSYMEDLFFEMMKKGVIKEENPRKLAVEYYGPLFLLIGMYDNDGNFNEYAELLRNHAKGFMERYGTKKEGEKSNE